MIEEKGVVETTMMLDSRRVAERRLVATLIPIHHARRHVARVDNWRRQAVLAGLVFSDASVALLIWSAASVFQSFWGRGPLTEVAIAAIVPIVAVWIGSRLLLGLYPGYGLDQVESLRRHTYSVLATAAVTAVFAVAFQLGSLLSRMLLVLGFAGLLLVVPLTQLLVKRAMKAAGLWGNPVIVVGSGEMGARITELFRERWELGYDPVAIFDYRLVLPTESSDLPSFEEAALIDILALARERGIDTIIFAMPHTRREHLAKLVAEANVVFRHVVIIPNLSGITNSAVTAKNFAGTFGVEIKYNLLDVWALRFKRVFDVAATVAGGLLILPLVLLLCALVWLESGGPVFYKAQRTGRDGRLFSCIKFRTMVVDAEDLLQRMLREDAGVREEYSKFHKLRDDPRVTRVGRFLRKTSLDELPQLWNVLRGEMSLVGPRPYLPRESDDIGVAQNEILRVPPGITGPWQVAGRNHTSFSERVRMDVYYVRDWSVWLDLVLLTQTARTVLLDRGAY